MPHPTPIELLPRGAAPDAVAAYLACAVCGIAHRNDGGWALRAASLCCSTMCDVCGGEKPARGYCDPCRIRRDKEREQAAFDKATKLTPDDYTGPVYDPVADRFYPDVGEAEEYAECDDREIAYLWACDITVPHVDPDDVIERAVSDLHEDATVDAEDELRTFLAEWNKKQVSQSWTPDYSRVVVLAASADVARESA